MSHEVSRFSWVGAVSIILWFACIAGADVKLASTFVDHMVIQRDKPIPVWGTATPGAAIQVVLEKQNVKATADAAGRWSITLRPHAVGGPSKLDVSEGSTRQVVDDVLFGDVWLCSGQSNMQMSLGECDDGKAVAADASKHGKLRLCHVGMAWEDKPQSQAKIEWTLANQETAAKFSAVGYYFGDELLKSPALADVPIGLMQASVGGTLAEAWAPRQTLQQVDPATLENSMFGIKPMSLYNGMIAPLGITAFKGVIWYQGEGNAGHPETYVPKLAALIKGWRDQFANPQLPFIIVQLPDYVPSWGGVYWQWLRDAQQQVANQIAGVLIVPSINTNDGTNLHPKHKHEIGRRIALLARQDIYGESIVGRGPVFQSARVDGNTVRVAFDLDGSHLSAADPADVQGFMIAGDDGHYRRAKAKIDGDTVVLSSDLVPLPQTVRYAWSGVPHSTLTNTQGLPAYPFRTDSLPIDSFGVQDQPPAHVFGNKDCEIAIADGRITSFAVKGKQLLSNETGVSGGVCIPTFFGPRGLGVFSELGPDLVSLSDSQLECLISLDEGKVRWTLTNHGNDAQTLRCNLSPLVNLSPLANDSVTLTRPGTNVVVTGVDKITQVDGTHALEFQLNPKTQKVIEFTFGQH